MYIDSTLQIIFVRIIIIVGKQVWNEKGPRSANPAGADQKVA